MTRAAAQLAPPLDTPLKKMGFEKSIFYFYLGDKFLGR